MVSFLPSLDRNKSSKFLSSLTKLYNFVFLGLGKHNVEMNLNVSNLKSYFFQFNETIQKTLSSFAPVAHNVITELSFLFLFCQNLAVLAITLTFIFASAYFQIYELLSIQILSISNLIIFTRYHYFVVNLLFLQLKLLALVQISEFGFFREQK